MKINFVLPNNFNKPIGGYKIIYEYANRLSKEGNEVYITFMLYDRTPFQYGGIHSKLRNFKIMFLRCLGKIYTSQKRIDWFRLNNKINIRFAVPYNVFFPEGDIVVATAWQTAFTVNHLSSKKGKKYYFIQHDEKVFGPEKLVKKTWKFKGLDKIVVASWLRERIENNTLQKVRLVKNFVDGNIFYVINPIKSRRNVVSMLYHSNPSKGSQDGISVLKKVKNIIPDLQVELFGTAVPPDNLPSYFRYTRNANDEQLREIYNKSAVFLFPSHLEGWGLTATEAMACGAALVSTKNFGVNDFGINKYSALITDIQDIDGMKEAVILLLNDMQKRTFIAKNGIEIVSQLTINKSFNTLTRIFNEAID